MPGGVYEPEFRVCAVLKQEINAILGTLQRLYSRIALRVLQGRTGSYRKEGTPGSGHDIATPLSDHIESLAERGESSSRKVPAGKSGQTARSTAVKSSRAPERPARKGSIVTRTLGGISRYFSRKHHGAVVQPHLSKKLEKSTWDHLQTALLNARQGKVTTARLHADIANNAMKEAAHYMSEAEYAKFKLAVDEKLGEIMAQVKRN